MQGVGTIFTAFREGLIRRDDAVMVTHAPEELGYTPLTLSLVDAEAALWMIAIPETERRALQRIARTMPFRHRSWDAILHAFMRRYGYEPAARVADFEAVGSLKRRDAWQLATVLAGEIEAVVHVERPPLTCFYQALLVRA
jgi:hypothetical protein